MYAYDYDANNWMKEMEGFNLKELALKAREMKSFLVKFCLVFANLNANEIETFLWTCAGFYVLQRFCGIRTRFFGWI